jgi:hypothetical protein
MMMVGVENYGLSHDLRFFRANCWNELKFKLNSLILPGSRAF